MKYQGCVTDESWHKVIFRMEPKERQNYINLRSPMQIDLDNSFDFIYSIGKLPRVYSDELKK